MAYEDIDGIHVFHDGQTFQDNALAQMQVLRGESQKAGADVVGASLMADAHQGYSQPIGGVIAYRNHVSPSGVGFDIGCGVMAVKTDIDVKAFLEIDRASLADKIARTVNFGLGGHNESASDHELFTDPHWTDSPFLSKLPDLKQKARKQLGTVGSGNHYVDVLYEVGQKPGIWIATHFGSRGFGHTVASGFLDYKDDFNSPPTLIEADTDRGLDYIAAMELAGEYAYAGRKIVIAQVLAILGNPLVTKTVHNHHNYAWLEKHQGQLCWTIRKGATPASPGVRGFVGGSMGDMAAIVVGKKDDPRTMNSTVHGAGRVMGRMMAKGKKNRPGLVTRQMMSETTKKFGVTVRGGDVDESPQVYRPLGGVLEAHAESIDIEHIMKPLVVVMAGADIRDPYKD